MLGQQWVSEWEGWEELQQDMTEKQCVRVAARLHAIALQQIPHTSVTNEAALRGLEAVGFSLQPAQSFGVNNCLIDAICLSLCAAGLVPKMLVSDVITRCVVAMQCRQHLVRVVGPAAAPDAAGNFPYLDAERDGPEIVHFLMKEFDVMSAPNLSLCVHDRFGNSVSDLVCAHVGVVVAH